MSEPNGPTPMRGLLPPEVERAAATISREVWGESYQPLRGVMHYGGGPAHAADLRRRADRWERLAKAARVCADFLPGEESR